MPSSLRRACSAVWNFLLAAPVDEPGVSNAELWEAVRRHEKQLAELALGAKQQMNYVQKLAARLDAATNEIANDLRELRERLASDAISEEDKALLDALAARLEDMGRDPENPVPEPPINEAP